MAKHSLTSADLAKMPLHVQQAIAAQLDAAGVQQQQQSAAYIRRRVGQGARIQVQQRRTTKAELAELEKQRLAALFSTNEYGWKTPAEHISWAEVKEAERASGKKGAGYYVFMACTFIVLGAFALVLTSHHGSTFHGGLFK